MIIREKNVLILDEGPTQGLDHTTLTEEGKYLNSFTQLNKEIVLSLHCNESKSFLFVNATKIYKIKARNSEIKDYALYLGNISKDFSIDFNPIDTNNILDIHKCLMKKT